MEGKCLKSKMKGKILKLVRLAKNNDSTSKFYKMWKWPKKIRHK